MVEDIPPDAAKIGALGNLEVLLAVTEMAAGFRFPLVVDPVMISKHGASLLESALLATGLAAVGRAIVAASITAARTGQGSVGASSRVVASRTPISRAAAVSATLTPLARPWCSEGAGGSGSP